MTLGALLAGLLLVLAGDAEAALRFGACPDVERAACAVLRVPLDRAGVDPGVVPLRVARLRGTGGSRTLVYLSGGPGGAGVAELASLRDVVSVRGYRVLGFDQRGTGRSGLLRCPELERDPRLRSSAAGERCATRLGARRSHFSTADTVEDLEALRVEAGAERLTLVGISYGTEVALAYARAHPDRVERLVLDSVVDPTSNDPYLLSSWSAMAPALRAICPDGCRGVTADAPAELAVLATRLRGDSVRARGAPRLARRELTALSLSDLMFDTDYAPELRAALPAAVASALRYGQYAPIARLLALAEPLAQLPGPRLFSSARYATVCESAPLPWPRNTPLQQRAAVAEARAAALGPGAFGPFTFAEARADIVDLCLRWPEPAAPLNAGASPTPYPPVPALVIQGEQDLRTPPAVSARVAATLPGARRLTVPGVGHAPLGADSSGCAQRELRRFLAGASDGRTRCPAPPRLPAPPVLPDRAARLAGDRAVRTARAVALTLRQVAYEAALGLGLDASGVPGLEGGRYRVQESDLRFDRLAVVPGVRLSGRPSRIVVSGTAAADGVVSVDRRGVVSGRLGGRRVRVRVESSSPSTAARAASSRLAAPARPVLPRP